PPSSSASKSSLGARHSSGALLRGSTSHERHWSGALPAMRNSEMINYNVDSDGIATITWDMPNRTMNVLNEASLTAYTGALEQALKDDKVKGIILTSAKADFIAGADLEMLLGTDTSDATKLMDQFSQLQKIFRRH